MRAERGVTVVNGCVGEARSSGMSLAGRGALPPGIPGAARSVQDNSMPVFVACTTAATVLRLRVWSPAPAARRRRSPRDRDAPSGRPTPVARSTHAAPRSNSRIGCRRTAALRSSRAPRCRLARTRDHARRPRPGLTTRSHRHPYVRGRRATRGKRDRRDPGNRVPRPTQLSRACVVSPHLTACRVGT